MKLSPAQLTYSAELDRIEQQYTLELPNARQPEQLAILKVRRMSAALQKLRATQLAEAKS